MSAWIKSYKENGYTVVERKRGRHGKEEKDDRRIRSRAESLEAQKTHYENYITSRDDWEFTGLYYDEGIIGTKKDKRPELLRLIDDCKAGKVDFVITKSIRRLEPTSAEKNCTNRTVNELLLHEVTIKAFNQILTERDVFLKTLQQNIAKAVVNADTLSPDGIQSRLLELQKELIKKANNKQDYDAIADEIFRLPDQKEQSEVDNHHREEAMNRIKELQDFISGQETDITGFDETLVKKLIEKIIVFADHFTMEFKSGITIDIEA